MLEGHAPVELVPVGSATLSTAVGAESTEVTARSDAVVAVGPVDLVAEVVKETEVVVVLPGLMVVAEVLVVVSEDGVLSPVDVALAAKVVGREALCEVPSLADELGAADKVDVSISSAVVKEIVVVNEAASMTVLDGNVLKAGSEEGVAVEGGASVPDKFGVRLLADAENVEELVDTRVKSEDIEVVLDLLVDIPSVAVRK
jgi:hypothetical protein